MKRLSLFFLVFYLILVGINATDMTRLLDANKRLSSIGERVLSGGLCNPPEKELVIECFQRQIASFFEPPNNVLALIRIQGFYQKYLDIDLSHLADSANPFAPKRVFEYQVDYLGLQLQLAKAFKQVADSETPIARKFKLQSHINLIMGKFFLNEWVPTLDPFFESMKKYQKSMNPADQKLSAELEKLQTELAALKPALEKGYQLNFLQQELYEQMKLLVHR